MNDVGDRVGKWRSGMELGREGKTRTEEGEQ